MVGWLCPTSNSADHPDGYLRSKHQPCRCSNTTPIWGSLLVPSGWAWWTGAEQVRALAVPWLRARLCLHCSCLARVKTEDGKSGEALGNMGLHLFSLLTLQQKVDNCFL